MQSMLSFCDECGSANQDGASICAVCQKPLIGQPGTSPASTTPAEPVKIAPVVPLQVVAGAPTATGPLKAGMLLAGRYRLVREIGQGGFGAVYLARDTRKRGRLVAIKQITLGLLKPREIIGATDAFNREITFLSTLSHPNLPQIYDHFTDPDHWYMVMQYIEGQTLEEKLQKARRGHLPLQQVYKIGLALTDVLGYLHEQRPPVIFRDLKPSNVMLTRNGHVYLIDFGIARRFAPEKQKDTGPLGSPGFAAPEQYGRAQTDARTDIYSLGATLQALLTGRDLLELRQGLPSLRSEPLPEELQALLNQMLEVEPEQRPAHVSEIEERLAWWSRRRLFDLAEIGKGALIGLVFWLWYGLLAVGVDIVKNLNHDQLTATPLGVRIFLVVLNLFPLAVFSTIMYNLLFLVIQRKQQRAVVVLILLLLMLLLAVVGLLPALFNGYPFIYF